MKEELLHPEKFCEDLCDNASPGLVMKKKLFSVWISIYEFTVVKWQKSESQKSISLIQSKLIQQSQQFRKSRASLNNQIPYRKIPWEKIKCNSGLFPPKIMAQNTIAFVFVTTSVIQWNTTNREVVNLWAVKIHNVIGATLVGEPLETYAEHSLNLEKILMNVTI